MMSSLQQQMISGATGQVFAFDELITGLGDGMKHILRELQSMPTNASLRTEYDAEHRDVKDIRLELDKAILYQCAVDDWLDCVGNSYGLVEHRDGLALIPFDRDREIARVVSTYRRLNYSLQDTIAVHEYWNYKLPSAVKRKLCEIPLVSRVYLTFDKIESIELGQSSRVLDSASSAVAAKLILEGGYYKNLLDEPLPRLYDFTLSEIINGWRLLQSLAIVIFDELGPLESGDAKGLLRFAPKLQKKFFAQPSRKLYALKDAEHNN